MAISRPYSVLALDIAELTEDASLHASLSSSLEASICCSSLDDSHTTPSRPCPRANSTAAAKEVRRLSVCEAFRSVRKYTGHEEEPSAAASAAAAGAHRSSACVLLAHMDGED